MLRGRAIWAGLHKHAFELEVACVQAAESTSKGNLCATNNVDRDTVIKLKDTASLHKTSNSTL